MNALTKEWYLLKLKRWIIAMIWLPAVLYVCAVVLYDAMVEKR